MSEQVKKCVNRATPNWVKQREYEAALNAGNNAILAVMALSFVGLVIVNVMS